MGRTRSGLVFSVKGQPLRNVAGDADMVAKVAAEADAIGYVDKAAITDRARCCSPCPDLGGR